MDVSLNRQQQKAVESTEGRVRVVAGPEAERHASLPTVSPFS